MTALDTYTAAYQEWERLGHTGEPAFILGAAHAALGELMDERDDLAAENARLKEQFTAAFRLALQDAHEDLFELLSHESPEAIIHARIERAE